MYRYALYKDREEAGKALGEILRKKNYKNPIVLGLPRGGVVLASEIASELAAPLDVVISRKIGAPDHAEFGIGAISEDEVPFFSHIQYYDPDSEAVRQTVSDEVSELRRRIEIYRGGHHLPELKGRTVIVVDDGLATGVTAIAAGKYLKTLSPDRLVLAVPMAPTDYPKDLNWCYDEIICPVYLDNMISIGMWYSQFFQVEDEEVIWRLRRSQTPPHYEDHV